MIIVPVKVTMIECLKNQQTLKKTLKLIKLGHLFSHIHKIKTKTHLKASKPSVAAYNAFKPNSTIRISNEISYIVLKNILQE